MAEKVTVELVDDLDGSKAEESVSFGLDGVDYVIDLSADNAAALRDAVAAYVAAARRTGGRKQRATRGGGAKAAGERDRNQEIRQWARTQGHQVSERGRIPQELVVKFQEAHAS
ncbi:MULTISPECIES: histone-like nucleoid-structuring protein Lsr2 [unclassified Crossiella]|uniref:histone-like nucleoid-structuring protein Lsr2 n=1 Tax=unclassified Crossiella TaxID=2620835 RepID=UPI00207C8228|nr:MULTISPECIES: Lsr2 family protein [unclassified Crossiella]MCO1579383.1 Lsr2 family protein [Crossiella sp. SN42]WHT19150.1 Lsr2 family protein [Crossiella sp. CA-258035]